MGVPEGHGTWGYLSQVDFSLGICECLGKKKKTTDLIMHVCNSSSEVEFKDCLEDRKTVKKHVTKKQVGEEGLYLAYISIS